MGRPRSRNRRDCFVTVRLTRREKQDIEKAARMLGFSSVSDYLRHFHTQSAKALNELEEDARPGSEKADVPTADPSPREFLRTHAGTIYHGDSLGLLHEVLPPKSVDLIMTSPPFGLTRKKAYGNEVGDKYLQWFRPFAEGFKRVLKDSGSLVIDIGGAWNPGRPTRSLYHFELLLMLCKEHEFHLAQEHYWWNPSKLPTPAEWVNVRRWRVKDAVNCIWWLSPLPEPKADNRRVLVPYSPSMRRLLKKGYTPRLRPSGHDISGKFNKDNGGAVPPNLIALANTDSNGRYLAYCREHGYTIHPTRYPAGIPEYFVRFLTDPGDLVVDPFAGSCVTGEVCERLGRHWICCERSEDYLNGARARFESSSQPQKKKRSAPYIIHPPCVLAGEDDALTLLTPGA